MGSPLTKGPSNYSPRKTAPKGSRIPPKVLENAVKLVKATRTYVFERFTQGDWDEIRSHLPMEYRWLSNEQLMHQACNLRKRGIFSSKAKKNMTALWADVKKAVRAYWSGDNSLEELGDLLKKLHEKKGHS